ncbi:MAG: GTP-binding protein [Oscillospiraceae bacterium]|nr:GTP-binding protein [Oscillospiraceae bacterium]
MKFKKFLALICTFAFMFSNLINVHADEEYDAVFVGDLETGKTALLNKMFHGTFKSKYECTHYASHFLFQAGSDNEVKMWDCPGRKDLHESNPVYFEYAKTVVICCDITNINSLNGIGKWIEMVRNARNIPIILAATKVDFEEDGYVAVTRADIEAKAKEYAIDRTYFTSAQTGAGTEELKEELFRLVDKCIVPETKTIHETADADTAGEALKANTAGETAKVNAAFGKKLLTATVAAAVAGAVIGTIRLIRHWLVNNRARSLPNNYEIKT